MKALAITNSKGGVGKTTTTVSLAAALSERGQRLLVVDMDPQASATRWLDWSADRPGPDHADRPYRVLNGSLGAAEAIVETVHGISLLPANRTLEQAERSLAGQPYSDASLRSALAKLDPDRFDVLLLDCPPQSGWLSSNALVAADALLIPVECRHLALEGFAAMVARVRRLEELRGTPLELAAILACRYDARTAEAPAVERFLVEFAAEHLPGVPVLRIHENVTLSNAAAAHEPIVTYAPRSTGARDYRALAADLLERL